MKIAIIGSPDRKELDFPLVEEAKLIFDDVLYVPIGEIILKISKDLQVLHKDIDVSGFDVVLPISTFPYKEFYYMCLKILEKYTYTPISSDNFFNFCNRTLFLKTLSENGIKVRRIFSVASSVAARTIINQLGLPVILDVPGKNIFIADRTTLKNILSMFKPGRVIMFKKPIKPESMIWVFVVGNEVVASYEKVDKNMRPVRVERKIEELAVRIKNLISSDFCVVNFLRVKNQTMMNQVSLSPDFPLFQKITSKNICRSLLMHLRANATEKRKNILDIFVDSINDFVRWFSHEVSHLGSTQKKT
ncbi:MAG: hypothetical protein QMD36_00310 [Candidatus Aenigmarchaeota archaeon]|nr:hypothetical protein [Candidatus Aenigmarchaeota archaeon]